VWRERFILHNSALVEGTVFLACHRCRRWHRRFGIGDEKEAVAFMGYFSSEVEHQHHPMDYSWSDRLGRAGKQPGYILSRTQKQPGSLLVGRERSPLGFVNLNPPCFVWDIVEPCAPKVAPVFIHVVSQNIAKHVVVGVKRCKGVCNSYTYSAIEIP
jgi:hypothetical protein